MTKIKLSDYIANFLDKTGIKHVWAITGGASIHMIHSVANHPNLEVICPHHEQAAAMSADAYSRVTGNMGCAIATSGPGATNMLTGICGAYVDSIPTLYLTGQVVRDRMKGTTGVRAMGFQETDIISMAKPITKYCAQILDKKDIRYELEKAVYLAKSGRPGPVLLDIPDDVQREMVDPEDLNGFVVSCAGMAATPPKTPLPTDVTKCLDLLERAKRPVVILGWGVRLAKSEIAALELVNELGIPVCPTWGAMDLLPTDHPLKVGGIGINGSRAGNYAVQNSDLLLVIGSRLSTRETGNPLASFARAAKIIMVDIDPSELAKFPKFGKKLHLPINCDAKFFMQGLLNHPKFKDSKPRIHEWKEQIKVWKKKYDRYHQIYNKHDPVDPYLFTHKLGRNTQEGDIITVDTGCAIPWMMQGFHFKKNQRVLHDFNNTAMGYGLPASIGSYFASRKPIICVTGDGSFLMNIQELATIQHHRLPIKIFLLNNSGYSMVRQTMEEWFNNKYVAVGRESLSFPDYESIAESFGLGYTEITRNGHIDSQILKTIRRTDPVLCNVIIPEQHRVWPKLKYGRPLEDMEPLLPRKEFRMNMLIEPWPGWDK